MQMKDILVLGIGNLVLRDEGVGIHAVDYLQKQNLPEISTCSTVEPEESPSSAFYKNTGA